VSLIGEHELRRSGEPLPSPEKGGSDGEAIRGGIGPAGAPHPLASRATYPVQGEENAKTGLAVTHLRLSNFRSYDSGEVVVSARPVVLAGANGAGKTNLLEAISLLAPGRGLRGAALSGHTRKGPASAGLLWAISATVQRRGESYDIGTGLEANGSATMRQVRLNGAPAQSSADLGELIQMAWLTPAMDRLFIESASGRRRFLDRLTLGFAPSHGKTSLRYEQATRERARLLKYGPRDPAWLSALEEQMAEHGLAIMAARSGAISCLNAALAERRGAGAFPSAQLNLDGEADRLFVEDGEGSANVFREMLERGRVRDAESGRTGFGPHVSDLLVRHIAKRMEARDCSTGEQKALLISIVLAQARQLSHIREGFAPILLLDEIVAHLDAVRRSALFEEILALGAQAWMTGTELSMFAPLSGQADIFEVADSCLSRISE
jgi:DNA replication and repair protein RecF